MLRVSEKDCWEIAMRLVFSHQEVLYGGPALVFKVACSASYRYSYVASSCRLASDKEGGNTGKTFTRQGLLFGGKHRVDLACGSHQQKRQERSILAFKCSAAFLLRLFCVGACWWSMMHDA